MPTPVSLGPHRLSLPRGASRDERVARSREMLCRALTLGTTVAFVGAGLSVPLGYLRWQGMALDLIRRTLKTVRGHPSDLKKRSELDTLESFERRLDAGEPTRATELTFALGLCQNLAKEIRDRDPKIGLILCAEGDMPDTYGIWEQGSEINHAIGLGQRVGQHVVQSLLHLSHTYVEVGHLRIAGAYLQDTERANHLFQDPDYAARIAGYRGLIAHLEGNLHKAEDHYRDAISCLEKAGRNPRAESIFRRHLADLLIAKEEREKAQDEVRISRALAESESAEYRDLVAYARISQGHVYRAGGALKEAMPEYLGCLRMARQIGIRRLEADALSELSRLALDLGDAENARRQAMAALRLANELGLGLRKTHGLVVLGLATVRTGSVELGKSYLRQALRMAEAQGYWLRGHEIERELEKLGEPPELSRVSRRGTM